MGPATTAVYTYVHPLSLHDALPICRGALRQEERPMNTIDHRAYFSRRAAQERRLADAAADCTARHAHREMARCYADLALEAPRVEWRSEEHTSELQSLMRISYAVFCLNTKKP